MLFSLPILKQLNFFLCIFRRTSEGEEAETVGDVGGVVVRVAECDWLEGKEGAQEAVATSAVDFKK